jgi:hypothetical protein
LYLASFQDKMVFSPLRILCQPLVFLNFPFHARILSEQISYDTNQ